MKIKELSLTNFRRFEQLDLKLPDSNFIILIGENGCGKSSVLDAMAVGLNVVPKHLKASLENQKVKTDNLISLDDIKNGEIVANLNLNTIFRDFPINFKSDAYNKALSQNYEEGVSNSNEKFSEFLVDFKNGKISELPIIVYYRINRTLLTYNNTPKIVNDKDIIIGYVNAFNENISAFLSFENWFISQENIENEQKIIKKNLDFELVSLKIIRKVVEQFLTKMSAEEFANLRVRRASEANLQFSTPSNQGELTIQKNNKEIKLKQLSSGEKMILLLVCDIARRLLILNSMDENCLEGEGVVLIDEIEMHLHPKWQRRIVPALKKVFPNIQFIATTHSPQVLSNLSDNDIIVLDDNKYYSPATNPYGRDSNGILEEIFGTSERPLEADKLVDEIFEILSNGQRDIEKAEAKLGDLRGHLGAQDPILLRIENLINRKKILNH